MAEELDVRRGFHDERPDRLPLDHLGVRGQRAPQVPRNPAVPSTIGDVSPPGTPIDSQLAS